MKVIQQRWQLDRNCWVDIRFSGVPTWRGLRLMIARLWLLLPPGNARIYDVAPGDEGEER